MHGKEAFLRIAYKKKRKTMQNAKKRNICPKITYIMT